jgi:glyoxylase-like metal-dependent hydrolase (beta-lactamase superfamily II)
MRIAQGVEVLEIPVNVNGQPEFIYPTLIWDEETAILVDTGYPGQLSLIEKAVNKTEFSFDKINRIIITHHDIDHIGSALSIKKISNKNIEILAHEEEIPYIQGEKVPLKLAQLEMSMESLPANMKIIYEKLKAGFDSCKVKIDVSLKDGEELPYFGGISVIHTPGHTFGHICLYLKQSKILIAGDMFALKGDILSTSSEQINFDQSKYLSSLDKVKKYDIKAIVCYHGGFYKGNLNNMNENYE